MTWTPTLLPTGTVWHHTDGVGYIQASDKGVFAIVGQRIGRFVKGERRLLDLLSQVDDATKDVLRAAWQERVAAVVKRDAHLIPEGDLK